MFERKQFTVLLFCVLIVSMPFVQAFSTAVPGSYVIYLEKDQPITQAMDTMKEQMPDISSIAYGSVKYQLLVHRIIEPLVWVGHGDMEGISTAQGKLSWGRFAQEVKRSPMMDIVLSCYSSELLEQKVLTGQEVITFTGEIDATLGGLVAAWLLTGESTVLQHAIERSLSLHCGKVAYDPLHELDPGTGGIPMFNLPNHFVELKTSFLYTYVFCKLSGLELAYHLVMAAVVILQILFMVYVSPTLSLFDTFAAAFFTFGTIEILIIAFLHENGQMTSNEAIGNVIGVFYSALGALWDAIQNASPGEQALMVGYLLVAGLFFIGQIIIDAETGGLATFIRIAATLACVMSFVLNLIEDLVDNDCVVG